MENESGLDEAQALLDHSSTETTKRYAHARFKKMKNSQGKGGIRLKDEKTTHSRFAIDRPKVF
jgi:hypothetical protein